MDYDLMYRELDEKDIKLIKTHCPYNSDSEPGLWRNISRGGEEISNAAHYLCMRGLLKYHPINHYLVKIL